MSSSEGDEPLFWVKHDAQVKKGDERQRPAPRSAHTLTIVGTNAYLIGGLVELDGELLSKPADQDEEDEKKIIFNENDVMAEPSNTVHRLQLVTAVGMEWSQIDIVGKNRPLPRWKHTATLFDNTQILVFGGSHSLDQRLNDVWIFDCVSYQWRQPNEAHNKEAVVPYQLVNNEWHNACTPRAGHSATLIGSDDIYIFGGYGGLGYGRRDLDDLYKLNLSTWIWTKLVTKGTAPERRSGHQACAVEKKICVIGGSCNIGQFDDMFLLDTEVDPPFWSKMSCSLPVATWNFAACSVVAMPSWKIFTFGGTTGVLDDRDRQGRLSNASAILDPLVGKWTYPKIEGRAPTARSDSILSYDAKGARLIVFGGWSDMWHGDINTLDVGNIVGPPYAITDIFPKQGPVTGGTKITITGIDFINTSDVIVRFGDRKASVDTPGVYVSQTKITCLSPDFTKNAPGTVDVRIALNGDSFTTTFQKFNFFSVTNYKACIMYGPGLLDGCALNEDVSFVIQARDDNNQNRTTGGDEFQVAVHLLGGSEDGSDMRLGGVNIRDLLDGRYIITYIAKYAGKYKINVDFMGTYGGLAGSVRGSGTVIEFDAAAPRDNNSMSGELVVRGVKADIGELQKFTEELLAAIFVRVKDDSWSPEEQIRVLMSVKEAIIKAEARAEETTLVVDRSECIIKFLRDQDVVIPGVEESLQLGKDAWAKIQREAPQVLTKINPMMRAHSSKIRTDIQGYEHHVTTYKEEMSKSDFLKFATGPYKSMDILDAADEVQKQQQAVCDKMSHIAKVFDCTKEMDASRLIVREVMEMLKDYRLVWETYLKINSVIDESKSIIFAKLVADVFEDGAKSLVQMIRRLPKNVKNSDAFKGLDKMVKEYVQTVPIIVSLRSPAMRERHWRELMDVVKKEFKLPSNNPTMTLSNLLELELHLHTVDVEEICEKAMKEAKHEDILKNLNTTWAQINFSMNFYKETDVPLLKLDDDIVEQLESDQMAVQSIVGGRYIHFKPDALEWQKNLGLISDLTQLLNEIQRTWSYLEPLFIGSEEVKKELPDDARRFQDIDYQVRSILQKAWKARNVKVTCIQPGLLQKLQDLQKAQEICKKSLSEFLDGKRRQFPRFYFMSEADLLDLLSNSSQPNRVLTQVDKILLSTKEIKLEQKAGADRPTATHFIAGVGKEILPFNPPLKLVGKAETYLLSLLQAQMATLSKCLETSMKKYPQMQRVQWLMDKDHTSGESSDPAQCILLVAHIDFSKVVEKSMVNVASGDSKAVQKALDLTKAQLADLINLTKTNLTKGDRQRVMCMITIDSHNRDIIDQLIKEKALSPTDFQWQSKLRPSFVPAGGKPLDNGVTAGALFRICDASFSYGFEYLGNGPRLVVTPLTDRIYVTATQALHLKMGCAPAGPAGTGKTESTKDLASALGKCCYVFNCSPEMDYQSMGNIFKGLSASGSWGCFDEFNRLIPEVLSVCSVQFKAVCDGLKAYNEKNAATQKVTIEGDTVSLDPTCGAFITMNPGYLGRSELPEGLKALFRPITVMVPDLVLICENMLMAEGFLTAKTLASKFYGLYSLLSELLSKQPHYDWGLRAVKSVLVVAGQLKRAEPDLQEDALLMRALRDFNIPKIVQADEVVFFGLLNDLFPSLNPKRVFDEGLAECVGQACEQNGLWPDPFFTLKVMQLDELLDIRHCVFIMGPPGSGKSTTWKMLKAARNIRHPNNKVKTVDLNPKVMPTEELYGHISMATREWKDGLLSSVMRDLGRVPDEKPKWIILDGDLDANWIESMNSVMDDNKMLTLASNERIPLKHYMRMIFEIRDLKFATPATVSRAGILYISTDGGSQWRSIIGSWVRSRPDDLLEDLDREKIHGFFEKYLPECLKFFASSLRAIVNMNDMSISVSLLRFLDTVLTKSIVIDENAFETCFVFCLIWGFGSVLTTTDDGIDHRKCFSEWFRAKFKSIKIPSRDTIFDYWLDTKTAKFESWKASPAFKTVEFDSTVMNMADITVPTAETASVLFWMDQLVQKGAHVMLAGPGGTGKTQLVNGLLTQLKAEFHIFATVNMNFYTNAAILLTSLEVPLQKRTGSTYGPPGAAKLVYFVDDLNLPEVDPYGTQSAIALLRQHIDYGHWYDQQKLSLKMVDDCQYLAALNPTAGSFSINPRLQRHFSTFAVGMPAVTSLHTIYQTFLDGHLNSNAFRPDVCAISAVLIKGALSVHKDVSETFRKTAANFHYEFSIRHLANIFQGLLVSTATIFTDPEKFVYLWLHESERVYGDRLVDYEDLNKFKQIMLNNAKKTFPQFNVAKFYLSGGGVLADPLVFCHFADGSLNSEDLMYDQATNLVDLRTTLENSLEEYNETNAVMNLVLFDDAVLHIARIVRIVKQTGGHALLVGVGGSGKQSLSRLAAFVCGYSVSQIMVSQTYGILDFKNDLQSMYNKAGIKQEGVLFLLTDTQITNEKFLVYINDLLSSGNIPDLYSRDEKEAICNSLASKAKNAGYSTEPQSVWKFFISKVRENLHCCLCFSPVGPGLRTRARRFPALASCTVIDWFQPWPEQALMSVGKKLLTDINVNTEVAKAIEAFMPTSFVAVNKLCKQFQGAEGRYVYTTPKSYLEMLNLYKVMLAKKRADTDSAIFRLQNGVEKLIRAAEDVVVLEANLKIMLESAEEKRRVAESIAATVTREKDVVEAENAKARVEENKVATIQAEVSIKQTDAAKDLALAEPALARAMSALDSLDRRDLGNCKTMTKPPPGVDDIFGGVMVLLAGINPNIIVQKSGKVRDKERTWDHSKKALLGNVNGFLDELKTFKNVIDEGAVPEMNWKEVRPFLELEHFNPEIIEKRNSAAAGLCSWVINIVNYFDIVQLVEPKRIALKAANGLLEKANEELNGVRSRVAALQARLDILTVEFNNAEATRKEAQHIAEKGKLKLELAHRLIKALGSEQIRWLNGVDTLRAERELLVGDCLLASAFISYIGPFTKKYRDLLVEETLIPTITKPTVGTAIPMTMDMEAIGLMCTEAEIAEYQTQGLPADSVSSENAAIVLNSVRYPLMIDPQLQAITWIKRRIGSKLIISRLGQKDLIKRLLISIERGEDFLIENMGENIEPTLLPVIARVSIRRGTKKFMVMGDQEVEISPLFRLYLHTKLSNPHYPPEVQAEATLVNFSVTQSGLEDQLLSMVVKFERADLAAQRSALILQQNLFTIKVKQLEDNILRRLAEASGDITEDRALIEELELSKKISDEISVKLDESRITSEKIDITSEKYRPVARRGALVFFVMNCLNKMHTYYMFSLKSFVSFFYRGISIAGKKQAEIDKMAMMDQNEQSKVDQEVDLQQLEEQIKARVSEIEQRDKDSEGGNLPERLNVLKRSILLVIYDFLRMGLFEKDKLTVVSMITMKLLVDEGLMKRSFFDVLVRGRAADEYPPRGEELAMWCTEPTWARLKAIEEDLGPVDPVFEGLTEKVSGDMEDWGDWYNKPDPEMALMPGEFKELSDMTRLLLIRVIRPDRLPFALSQFVSATLGEEFVNQPPFSMASTYFYTSNQTPVLFVLYPGVDPTSWVEDLGKTMRISEENGMFANISMGQGQEKRADETIIKLAEKGGWVFLQNVHLMQTWLPTLDEKLETLVPHPNFRVFISAEPPPLSYLKNVPEGLMQSCITVSNEPPSDLKANLNRAWAAFSQMRINGSNQQTAFKACLFGLSFFHSVMLGRRRFGFQGWSRGYGFNMGDLRICADVLESYLGKSNKSIPFQDLRYIFGEIMYGGHITDFFDRRTNNTYLAVIMNDNLLKKGELAPRLICPEPQIFDYNMYQTLIDKNLPTESPIIYGLHPNAEIGFLTNKAETLFQNILLLEMGGSASESSGGALMNLLKETIKDLIVKCPAQFDLIDLAEKTKARLLDPDGPYIVVVVQECTRLNTLLAFISLSLDELMKGLNGQLNMSQGMEDMAESMLVNMVPGRNPFHATSWEKLAWFSRKSLSSWFADLIQRRNQLQEWIKTLVLPFSTWLPGLMNPTALLTAIKQVTARKQKLPLDNMSLDTHITRMMKAQDAITLATYPEDGIFVHGMLMEGARWTDDEESADSIYMVGHTPCAGYITESKLKQLLTLLPVMYVKAVPVQPDWSPEAVGYLRNDPSLYECPVYLTSARGGTFVFLSTLKSRSPTHKWILAGVALLTQSDD